MSTGEYTMAEYSQHALLDPPPATPVNQAYTRLFLVDSILARFGIPGGTDYNPAIDRTASDAQQGITIARVALIADATLVVEVTSPTGPANNTPLKVRVYVEKPVTAGSLLRDQVPVLNYNRAHVGAALRVLGVRP